MIQFIFFITLLLMPYSIVMAMDCEKPETAITQVICADYRLSQMNTRLERIYQQLETSSTNENVLKSWLETLEQQCKPQQEDCLRQQYEQRIRELSQKTWSFQAPIHPDVEPWQFDLIGIKDGDTAHIQKITISNQDGQLLQTFVIENVSEMLKETETLWLDSGEGFKIEDVNFDGYQDIRLMEFLPAGANVPYLYWLYQVEQKQFVFNQQYSQLSHLTLDSDKKQVVSQYRMNAVEHGTDYYSVDKYQLILIRQELLTYVKNDQDELELFELVKERVADELQIISQTPVE
jgi:uncharacterized protein